MRSADVRFPDQVATPPSRPLGRGASLRTLALAALATRLADDGVADEAHPEARFLLAHRATIDSRRTGWAATLSTYLERPRDVDQPLVDLAGELDLSALELLAVALADAVEDDLMVGRAIAYLQAPLGGSRPTVGLIANAFAELAPRDSAPVDALVDGAAVRSGLLTLPSEGAPLPERPVAVPLPIHHALAGRDGRWPGGTIGQAGSPTVPLPESTEAEARRHAAALSTGPGRGLILRTGAPAEGHAVAAAIAAALGRRPLFLETDRVDGLGPWLTLRQLVPVFQVGLGPGERRVLTAPPFYVGPLLALGGPDGSLELAGGTALTWTLSVPPRAERERLWRLALGDADLATELARDHRHGYGRIAHLGRLAQHHRTLRGADQPTREDVVQASWGGDSADLSGLAQPLTSSIPDEALVRAPGLRQDLNALLLRCRARDELAEGLGPSATARYHPGVRALFVGPSGTGKTLAAGWLATRLGLPLYRVDLAAVTSKYIGETEKNLAQLLARAEQAEVVLLFDEADSLFGKRTDVKEANDRFANAQTNYLLQRIETFDGIVILTSNSRGRFDSAFSRRLDLIVEFALPGPEERRALWQSHLGERHRLTPRELNQLAAAADVGGGNIRNAVLAAAVLARAESRPIALGDLIQGLQAEYRKLGRQLPGELQR